MMPSFSNASTCVLIAVCFSAEWCLCGSLLEGSSHFVRSISITIESTFEGSGRTAVEKMSMNSRHRAFSASCNAGVPANCVGKTQGPGHGSKHHLCRARRFDTPALLGQCSTCCAESKGQILSVPLRLGSIGTIPPLPVPRRFVKWCLVVARCEIQEAEHRWFHCSQPRQCLLDIRNRPTF